MSGTYYPSNPAYGMPPPMGMPPAELQSLKSMLGVARILTLVIAIITLLIVIGVGVALLFAPILVVSLGFTIVALIIDWIIWFQIGEIIQMVDRGQYDAAKNKTIIWMILGFIFGWIIVGIFLLLAYLKFDPVINWQRQMGQGAMPPGQPFGYGTAPMGGSPMMGSAPAGGPPMATPPAA
ncbi:MAG TPA: hypothetical protein VLY85_02795, partial [Thermoplasmata archaeon]|nr:hypothetical protein [Thermoplasmata archaeon]